MIMNMGIKNVKERESQVLTVNLRLMSHLGFVYVGHELMEKIMEEDM